MNYQAAVLLYSNYSPSSQKLLTTLQSCPINLATTIGLTSVCIDNETIRKKVCSCKNIVISIVPVLLLIFPDGSVEKYEGIRLIDWIENIVKNNLPPPVETQPQKEQVISKQINSEQEQPVTEDTNDHAPNSNQQQSSANSNNKPRSILKKPKQPLESETTKMEDLESEEEGEEGISPPPMSLRSSAGTYEISDKMMKTSRLNNRDMTKNVKTTTEPASKDQNALMATAMAMQKERESN